MTFFQKITQRAGNVKKAGLVFQPIRLMEINLDQPLPALTATDMLLPQTYQQVLALVRLHAQPLGIVTLEMPASGIRSEELAEYIGQALLKEINEHLTRDGLSPVDRLTANGLSLIDTPLCLRERLAYLASAPFASVVICTHNRTKLLANCLDSLLALEYPHYEIVVVDNAPATDTTEQMVKQVSTVHPRVRYVREDRQGQSWARNRGLAEAKGAIVVYTDDDTVVDRYWLSTLAKGFTAAPNIACVTGMILPMELETQPQLWLEQYGGFSKGFQQRIFDLTMREQQNRLYPYTAGMFGSGANMAFLRSFLLEIGGFDPALGPGSPTYGGDDLSAFYQVITRGYKLCYEPTAIVRHLHYRDYAKLRRQLWGYGIGLAAFITKCITDEPRRIPELLKLLPAGILYALSPWSPKNIKKQQTYPKDLTRLEIQGMFYGPIAFAQSKWRIHAMKKHTHWDASLESLFAPEGLSTKQNRNFVKHPW